jgi:hypothetical protein
LFYPSAKSPKSPKLSMSGSLMVQHLGFAEFFPQQKSASTGSPRRGQLKLGVESPKRDWPPHVKPTAEIANQLEYLDKIGLRVAPAYPCSPTRVRCPPRSSGRPPSRASMSPVQPSRPTGSTCPLTPFWSNASLTQTPQHF